jgi:hypothetical protein
MSSTFTSPTLRNIKAGSSNPSVKGKTPREPGSGKSKSEKPHEKAEKPKKPSGGSKSKARKTKK